MHTTGLTIGGQRMAQTPERHAALLAAAGSENAPAAIGSPRPATNGSASRPASLYIHVPFCFHKCHYCDFYSFVDSRDRQGEFTRALQRELEAIAPHAGPLETIFVGGGTPTLLRPDLWADLLRTLNGAFELKPGVEFSVECNPETASGELFQALVEGGVNRLSVGAQSFDPRHLKTLERWHDPASVGRALELADAAGIGRRSLDLIFGVPGQTLDDWQSDLEAALALPIDHVSAYALTYEPGTAMTKRLELGRFEPIDHDLEADMQLCTRQTLQRAGFDRYEVSNFARTGAECRHNLAYWRQSPWLAAGPSASAHVGGWRWKLVPRLTDWMLGASEPAGARAVDVEPPNAARALAEVLMTGVRLREGLSMERVRTMAAALPSEPGRVGRAGGGGGAGARERVLARLDRAAGVLRERGLLAAETDRLAATEAGVLFADDIAGTLMQAVSGD